jgi:DNA polymerase III delta prime subunit
MELNKNFDATYAPKTLDDIAFTHNEEKHDLQNHITGRSGFPSSGKNGILLVGDTGSGKSTLAKMLPDLFENARGGSDADYNYLQITTGANSGVKLLGAIENQVALVSFQHFHYIILDEVDLMSPTAREKLKSVMNRAFKNVIYIMTTNDKNKVLKPVVNRCHVIMLDHAPASAWLPLFRRILHDHGITHIDNATMLKKIDQCDGSGRDVIESAKKIILRHDEGMPIDAFTATSAVV